MFSVYVLALSTTRYVNNFSKARLKCCTAMLQISFLSENSTSASEVTILCKIIASISTIASWFG